MRYSKSSLGLQQSYKPPYVYTDIDACIMSSSSSGDDSDSTSSEPEG
jgi:hypothetical protein